MNSPIYIHHVQTLNITLVGDCETAPTGRVVSRAPAGETGNAVPPPMQMLRRAIQRACATCGDTGQITRNPSGDVGDFETAPCPVCSRERRAE